jgi:hypothetical protein
MIDRRPAIALSAALGVLAVVILAWWVTNRTTDDEPAAPETASGLETPVAAGEAILYFAGKRDRLYAERRSLPIELEGGAKLREVITLLLQGPDTDDLTAVLPPEIEVAGVSLSSAGTLFLDLSSKTGSLRGMGSTEEMLAVYSLVNTLLANEPSANAVVLLWNGRQHPSLAGHIDTARPLTANSRLIAESS